MNPALLDMVCRLGRDVVCCERCGKPMSRPAATDKRRVMHIAGKRHHHDELVYVCSKRCESRMKERSR